MRAIFRLLCLTVAAAVAEGRNWTLLNDTDFVHGCNPQSPAVIRGSAEECADFCFDHIPYCAAVGWLEKGDHGCNFKCASDDKMSSRGVTGIVVRPGTNKCHDPRPPPPPHLTPTIHFAPPSVYPGGSWHDIAGAITHNGVHHIYQGTGWNHAMSTGEQLRSIAVARIIAPPL